MKPLILTDNHKILLKEMCDNLLPNKLMEINDNMLLFGDTNDNFSIHWFEFCVIHLCDMLYIAPMTSLGKFINETLKNHYKAELCNNVDHHPIDILYGRFNTNRKKNFVNLKLKDINYLFVEVPDDAYDFWMHMNTLCFKLTKGMNSVQLGDPIFSLEAMYESLETKYEPLFSTKNASENSCKLIVEGFFKHDSSQEFDCWRNYFNPSVITYSKLTAKESLISLIQILNLDIDKNYLILKEKI